MAGLEKIADETPDEIWNLYMVRRRNPYDTYQDAPQKPCEKKLRIHIFAYSSRRWRLYREHDLARQGIIDGFQPKSFKPAKPIRTLMECLLYSYN